MATPPGSGGSGNDGASLHIDTSTTAPQTTSELEALGAQSKVTATDLDKLTASLDKNQAAQEKLTVNTGKLSAAQREQAAQRQASLDLQARTDAAVDKELAYGYKLIAVLQDEIKTFEMSRAEVQQYRAEIAGVGPIAAPLTAELERLTRAQFENQTQMRRDIETLREYQGAFVSQKRAVEAQDVWLHEQRAKAWQEFVADANRTLAAESASIAEREKIQQQRDIWQHERVVKEHEEAVAWLEKTLAAQEAAAKRQIEIEQNRDVVLNNMRNAELASIAATQADMKAIQEKRDVEMHNVRTKAIEDEMKLVEKQAIMDIKYTEMTVAAKVKELEKLAAYQQAASTGAITPTTMANTFAPAALKDLPNLTAYKRQLEEVEASLNKTNHATEGFNVTNKSFARELIVIGHEFVTGNWARIPGSFMVLAERMNAAALLFSGMGLAALGVVASVGALVYAMVKGAEEQVAMQRALVLTGNYAGTTEGQLNHMAEAAQHAGANVGTATEAIIMMAGSGKFTASQIEELSTGIAKMEQITGQSVEKSVKEFESLRIQTGASATQIREDLLKAMMKLDDQHHYLNASMINEITTLIELGKTQDASTLAINQLKDANERMVKEGTEQLGYFAQRWIFLKNEISGVLHMLGEMGKAQTKTSALAEANLALQKFDNRNADYNAGVAKGGLLPLDSATVNAQRNKLLEARNAAQVAYDKELADAQQRGRDQQLQSEANHIKLEMELDKKRLEQRKKGEETLQDKITKIKENFGVLRASAAQTGIDDPKASAAEEQHMIDLVTAANTKKAKAASDGRKQILMMDMADAKTAYTQLENNTKAEEALIKEDMRMKETTTEEGYAQIRVGRVIELAELKNTYQAQRKILEDYNAKDARDKAEQVKRIHLLDNAYAEAENIAKAALVKNDKDEELAKYKDQAAILKEITTNGKSVVDSLQKQIDKEKLHNEEIGKTKEQIELAKKAQEEAFVADLQNQADAFSYAIANFNLSKDEEAIYTTKLQQIQQEIALRKQLAGLQDTGAALESSSPAAIGKLADESAKKWKQAGEDIKKSLKDAFGGGGEAIGKMFAAYTEHKAQQIKIDDEYQKKVAAAQGTTNEYQKIEQAGQERSYDLTRSQIAGWGQMADAAAGYFDESSTGYKTLHAVAQVFHLAEMAMIIMKIGQQAISAVLNQGQGDPYSAFARMAAMAAVVTGLGVAISASSAGAQQVDVAKKAQEAQGTGTVLGDTKAQSDSIRKSLDLLGDNSNIALKYTSQMVMSLHNIESGIGGLANIVYRSTGMTTGQNFGILEGTIGNKGDPVANALGVGGDGASKTIENIALLGLADKLHSIWGSTTQTIVDTGLKIQGSVNDLMHGNGVQQYAEVENKKTSFFGLVKDYSYNTVNQDAGGEIAKQFGQIFTNLNQALLAAGSALGQNNERTQSALNQTQLVVDPVSFKDLKGQELVDALNAVVSKASDQLAQSVLPGMEQFSHVGEGYAQTAIRVAAGVEKAQLALGKLGISAINYSEIANKQGDAEAEMVRQSIVAKESTKIMIHSWEAFGFVIGTTTSGIGEIMNTLSGTADEMISSYKALIEIRRIMMATNTNQNNNRTGGNLTQATVAGAGGLDELASGTKDFLDKYYTAAEKTKFETARMTDEFSKLGLLLPTSKDEFKALLTGIDQTSEAGQKLYGSMITLSGSFADLMDSGEQASKAMIEVNRVMKATATAPANRMDSVSQATIKGAGGEDQLSQGAADFLNDYYSAAEKVAIETAHMTEQFRLIGHVLPTSKEEFRQMLTGIDLTSAAGQELYGSMITLSGGFSSLMDSVDAASKTSNDIIDKQLERVNKLTAQAERWLSIRNDASSLQDDLTTNMGGKPDTSARQEALWAMLAQGDKISPEQQLSLAKELQDLILKKYQVDKANATDLLNVAKSLRTYLDSLKVGDLAPGTNTDKLKEAQSQYQLTLTKAQGGDKDASNDLQNKAQAYLSMAREYYASSDPYKQIFASVYTSLDQYATTAESAEQLQSEGNEIAQGQIDELGKLRDIVSTIMEKADNNYQGTVGELQDALNALQMIYSALNVLSTVPDLLNAMPAELASNLQSSIGGLTDSMTQGIVGIMDATGSANDQKEIAAQARADETNRILQAIAQGAASAASAAAAAASSASQAASAAASSGNKTNDAGGAVPTYIAPFYQLYFGHANGLNMVPYDGYKAELHRGERVLTAKENEEYTFKSVFNATDDEKVLTSTANRASMVAGNSGASNNAMAQEIKALREELAGLRKDTARHHQESVASNYDANDRAANKVAAATCDAADKANWSKRSAAIIK